MDPFKPVGIDDRALIERYTYRAGRHDCDLAFANLFCWAATYRAAWCERDGFLLLRLRADDGRPTYLQPLGEGDFTRLLPALESDARAAGCPLRLSGLTTEGVKLLRRARPDWGARCDRDTVDYLYNASDLQQLPGRRYQPKRNHINRFEALYDYRYEPLEARHAAECMRLERVWRTARADADGLTAEQQAMQRAFDHFDALGLRGGCLYVGDRLAAFTYGSAIDDDCFCIHAEKADTAFEGAFSMINRLFARSLPPQYTVIDREEDLGIEGLRRSKLSYHPAALQTKYTAWALDDERIQIRSLWERCFGDAAEEIDPFVMHRYAPSHAELERDAEGRIVGMLHLVPFGETVYVFAVATHPDHRRRGIAGRLLERALVRARAEGFRFAALIPASEELRRYYARFGFEERRLPVTFRTRDGYDLGTGSPDTDLAMIRPLGGAPFCGDRLLLEE